MSTSGGSPLTALLGQLGPWLNPLRLLKLAGDESPGIVHVELVAGAEVRVTIASKGFGAENMSALKMLVPADGVAGIRATVLDVVEAAGANACPPIIVGPAAMYLYWGGTVATTGFAQVQFAVLAASDVNGLS